MRKYYIAVVLINLIVITCVIAGFIVGGSPTELQDLSLDAQRISAFSTINYAVQDYYRTYSRLPLALSDLTITNDKGLVDPKTGQRYAYQTVGSTSFKLCTEFSTDSKELADKYSGNAFSTAMIENGQNGNNHKKGYDCIEYKLPNYVLNPN